MESSIVKWPQRRMVVLQRKGKIMVWRNGQTTHLSLHPHHLLARRRVRKQVSNGKGYRFQLRDEESSVATRGLQGPGKPVSRCLEAPIWVRMPLRYMKLYQRPRLDEDCFTVFTRTVEKSLVKAPSGACSSESHWKSFKQLKCLTQWRDCLRVPVTIIKVLVCGTGMF